MSERIFLNGPPTRLEAVGGLPWRIACVSALCRMLPRWCGCMAMAGVALAVLVAGPPLRAESPLEETRSVVREWVRTEQLISREAAAWQAEQALLQDMIQLRENELAQLRESLADLRELDSGVEQQRAALAGEREALREHAATLSDWVASLEAELAIARPTLPDPLERSLAGAFDRLSGEAVPLGMRLQGVIGILNEIEQFNTKVHLSTDLRQMPDGRMREVQALYFGLGGGFYVDGTGRHAGRLIPTADGWVDQPAAEWAEAIRRAVDVHQRTGPVEFVRLPFGGEKP